MSKSQVVRFLVRQIGACLLIWTAVHVQAQVRVALVASGSSLAGNLFQSWGAEFARRRPDIRISYVSTSSRDGIQQISMLRGDFAVGEIPLTHDQERPKARAPQLGQIPLAVITIVPIYNVPGRTDLRFTGEVLGQIYAGKISNWSDGQIAKLNPAAPLPSLPITVVNRPQGTGSRHVFVQFLMKTSPEFRRWQTSGEPKLTSEVMAERSKGMLSKVAGTPGAIGFVDLSLAVQSGVAYGQVQNGSGKFVKASPESVRVASAQMEKFGFEDARGSLLDAGDDSYPLTGFLWAYVPVTGLARDRMADIHDFLEWCLADGQRLIANGEYSPLSKSVATRARAQLQLLFDDQGMKRGSDRSSF